MLKRMNDLTAIFLTAGATLLFEITVTKIFEYSLWGNYAYLVISTAMLGLGFSGVVLTRWSGLLKIESRYFLSMSAFLCSLMMVIAYIIINYVSIHLPEAPSGWGIELLHVAINFVALASPFFFFGLVISYIFEKRADNAGIYYGADLLGAGIGSFVLLFMISAWEPQGLVAFSVLITMLASLLFLYQNSSETPMAKKVAWCALVVLLVAGAICVPFRTSNWSDLKVHVSKRNYLNEMGAGVIEASGWSTLSRVDIAPMGEWMKRIWISGGINESSIYQFDGDFETLRAGAPENIKHAQSIVHYDVLPYLLKTNATVCMIGTSGGSDTMNALRYGARKVVGVEMDPMIAYYVTNVYSEFAGNLFNDGDYTELVVDEGRSYLKRTDRKFDVIQMVNNYTPIAFANGALNLSETYLLTVESFKEFYDRLTDDGILCLNRHGVIRMVSTAVEMFRRMGMKPSEYSKHMVVCRGPRIESWTFMLKKSPFTPEEIEILDDYYKGGALQWGLVYAPYFDDLPDLENNLYYKFATADNPEDYYDVGAFRFSPPTDNKPYYNHWKVLGRQDRKRHQLKLLPEEISSTVPVSKVDKRIDQGDLPPLIVLVESIFMSMLFIGLPLFSKKEMRDKLKNNVHNLWYFACLGIAFILIEICLIQRLVLFLGAPVYSISTVLGSLLVFAGVGSLVANRIVIRENTVEMVLWMTTAVVVFLHLMIPVITDLFLHLAFSGRMCITIGLVGIFGFFMGMPLPTGFRYLKSMNSEQIIPWAWAINGCFTVIGSALTVVIAPNYGFSVVFFLAAALYAIAPLFLHSRM